MSTRLSRLRGAALAAWKPVWLIVLAAAFAAQALALAAGRPLVLTLLGAAQGAVLVGAAILLFRRRPRDPVAAMLSLGFLVWAVTGADLADSAWIAALDRLRFLLLVAALLLFPDGRFEPRWTRHALALSCLVFALGLAEAAGLAPAGWFLPPATLCVAVAIVALALRLRAAPPCGRRQQLKWVALGLAAGLALILAARLGARLAPPHGTAALLAELSLRFGIMLMALGFLVSLLRYRLYDAEAAISRSAAYLALTLTLVGIFAASEASIELFGQRYLGMQAGDLAGGIAAAIAAVLIAPLHERISGWAEQRFHRDLVVLREELPALLADVREQVDMAGLAALLLPRLEAGVRSAHVALVVDGRLVVVDDLARTQAESWLASWSPPAPDPPLQRARGDALFPLRIALAGPAEPAFAWLLLGPRPDGRFYRADELAALEALVAPLRRAVGAVRRRERHAAEGVARQAALLGALDRLAGRVAALEAGLANMRILHRTHSQPEV
jgi:hypothetical protein